MSENVDTADQGGEIIAIKSVGVRWHHPGGFLIDRPHGLKDYTFVQWLTPTTVKIDGVTQQESPSGCIFYRPGEPHWYSGNIFTPFVNHWFHFNGSQAALLLEECEIPTNRSIHLRNDSFIEPALLRFLKESMSGNTGRRAALSAYTMLFLVEFGRALRWDSSRSKSARNMELQGKFEDLRERLRERCVEQWTLGKMAAELHLSASRFSNLYREFFAAKPVDDLIRMRIDLAEYYLRTTAMPVNYVAHLCGFTDIYYFSRMFKTKTGKTATTYRSETRTENSLAGGLARLSSHHIALNSAMMSLVWR